MADGESIPLSLTERNADLPVRIASAVAMLAVVGTALWFGDWPWALLVVVLGVIAYWEWARLILRMTENIGWRVVGLLAGLLYIGIATTVLALGRQNEIGLIVVGLFIAFVVATDVGAYFAGRTIGGPKIAPSISPSKTWAGLLGGMVAAALVGLGYTYFVSGKAEELNEGSFWPLFNSMVLEWLIIGALAAVVAQSGDFLESWMKRKAGVKDSSNLIPGHGGILDRVDGLLAVVVGAMIYGALVFGFPQ